MRDPSDPETLLLGPFVGDPTPHVRIPVSQGICGAAVASGKTVVADDVKADPRYLSCSTSARACGACGGCHEDIEKAFAKTRTLLVRAERT